MDKESQILHHIKINPFISQQELAEKIGISRSAVAGYIASLTRRGAIRGRAYILQNEPLITCVGGANLDRKAHSKQKVRFHSSNPVAISESAGGVARNIAENLGRLGSDVSLLTSVGDDKEGEWVLRETKRHGVDISQVWTMPGQRTGTYTALLNTDGEMVVSLADMDIYDAITPEMLHEKWAQIAASRVVFLDTNLSADVLHYIIGRCNQEGITLFIDPVSSAKAKKLPDGLAGVEAILPNREEAEQLSGMEIKTLADCKEASSRIRGRGVTNVIMTLGEQGVYFASEAASELLPALPVEVRDVTGAGDAFASGLLFGILHNEDIPGACRLGLAAAALTLQTEHSVSPNLQPEQLYEIAKGMQA